MNGGGWLIDSFVPLLFVIHVQENMESGGLEVGGKRAGMSGLSKGYKAQEIE